MLDHKTLTPEQCCDALYQIGGVLRRMGRTKMAKKAEDLADKLYPGDIKTLPIVPRTVSS